jgi:hypothetical protein
MLVNKVSDLCVNLTDELGRWNGREAKANNFLTPTEASRKRPGRKGEIARERETFSLPAVNRQG